MSVVAAVATPYRMFRVRLRASRHLTPTFTRLTFAGPTLHDFADNGYDQRVKLLLPDAAGGFEHLPEGADWYARWRGLPDERRNPMRTYTVRAVRQWAHEVDVDVAAHGAASVASRWAATAVPGAEAALLGPDRGFPGDHGGIEWRPPGGVPVVLAGDETAVPAILAILQRLPRDAHGEALLEVPARGDASLGHAGPAGLRVRWLPRRGQPPGSRLLPLVEQAVLRLRQRPAGVYRSALAGDPLDSLDVDRDVLWETPAAATTTDGLYVWLAGEAASVARLRRRLVVELGLDRRSVAFMGYWRQGRSEPS